MNILRLIWMGAFILGMCCGVRVAAQEGGVPAGRGGMPAPVLVAFDGAVFRRDTTLMLDWDEAPGAVSYTLEYADNPAFARSTTVTGVTASEYLLTGSANPAIDGSLSPAPLAGGSYYWRVKAVGEGVESAFSTVDSFVLASPFPTWTLVLVGAGLAGYGVWQIWV